MIKLQFIISPSEKALLLDSYFFLLTVPRCFLGLSQGHSGLIGDGKAPNTVPGLHPSLLPTADFRRGPSPNIALNAENRVSGTRGPLTAPTEKTRQIPTGPLGWIVSRLRRTVGGSVADYLIGADPRILGRSGENVRLG